MIRAIIFDCYGVLASDGWIPFKKKHFGHDPRLEREATELNRQANAGLISMVEFIRSVAELAGVPKADVAEAVNCSAANEELFEYIRDNLKPKYKLGLLSNAGSNMLPDLFTSQQIGLFDEIALSYQTGCIKPQQRAYEAVAEGLGVESEECIFVDDQQRHCTGAQDTGMHPIVYRDFDQFRREIETLLEQE